MPNSATIEELSNLSLPSGVDIEIKMIMEAGSGDSEVTEAPKKAKKPAAKKTAKKA